ncbi:MAG: Hsp20/alpha crystallin family protein [Kiritimatiellia bacterium]
MSIRDLVPRMGRDKSLQRRPKRTSVSSLQEDMNRLFDEFFDTFDRDPFGLMAREPSIASLEAAYSPRVNVSETDRDITVSAELPGMDEKDVTVEVGDDAVTISGEKKDEQEKKGRNWHRVEHTYGSFRRVVPLPAATDAGQAKAKFKKGVLTVTVSKREPDQATRKTIEIEAQ